MKRFWVVSCLLVFFASLTLADSLGEILLKRGIGARAAGMGGAFSAVADDAGALFYNPAGLAETGLGYTYGNMDSQQKTGEFSFTLLKLGYIGYAEGKITNLTNDQVAFSALGFGNRSGWLNWGTNFKNLEWTIGGAKDSGWTGDIGGLMRITPQLKLAAVARDVLTTKARLVPASLRLGIAYRPFDGQLLLAADAELFRSTPSFGHFGVETNLGKGLSLRAGLDRAQPAAGISLDLAAFKLDYALLFSPDGKNLQRYEAGIKISPEKERPFSIIKPKEFALINLSGSIKGGQTEYSFLGGVRPGLDSILENIRAAYKDSGIDGILIRLGGLQGGIGGAAIAQEIRFELLRAREKGKKIVVYIEGSAVGDEYYIASVADKIIAAPGSAIGGLGRSLEIYRFAGSLKKLGIDLQVFSRGKYKTSFDWLSPEMSKEQRAMLEGIVSDLYRQMLTDIADSRKIKLEKVKEIGDGMFFPAAAALKMGLIDKVGYLNDAQACAGELCGDKEAAKIVEPRQIDPEEAFFAQVFGVAVIEINGEMVSGSGGQNVIFGGGAAGADKVVRDIRRASEDIFVKAIILRIDSPGGSPIAAGEIAQAVKYAREKKKLVVASLGSMAASAGYYAAAAADKIVADPSTVTGSIGVIGYFPEIAGLLKNIGATAEVVKEGAHADMFSGLRKFTSVEVRAIERVMDETYDDFVQKVSAGRNIPTAEAEKLAQGKVYTGKQALDLKLVDKLGGFSDAIDLARKEGKVPGEPRLIYYREALGLFPWMSGYR